VRPLFALEIDKVDCNNIVLNEPGALVANTDSMPCVFVADVLSLTYNLFTIL
jgi:hypothetical protein